MLEKKASNDLGLKMSAFNSCIFTRSTILWSSQELSKQLQLCTVIKKGYCLKSFALT